MNILFPLDVATMEPGNPYVLQLIEALIHRPEVTNVGFGSAALYWPKPRWNVIHVQWPEALLGWKKPTQSQASSAEF